MRELRNAMSGSAAHSETDKVEIWFHEDCISWMADIRLIGHVILGIFLIYKRLPFFDQLYFIFYILDTG